MKSIIITSRWLEEQNACSAGRHWFTEQKSKHLKPTVNKLIKQGHFSWANWAVTRFMTQQQQVKYACFAASLSLKDFEKICLEDKRPRLAIEAALQWANNPTEENRSAARSAAWSARWSAARWSAAWSAWSAESAESAAWFKILNQGLKILGQ